MKKLFTQLIRFGIVGAIAFLIDYAIMIALTELAGINYLVSSGISFTISVIVNYILSITIVFKPKKDANKTKEFIIFVFLSVIGLGLNQLLMYIQVDILAIFYMLAKIVATAVVMIYNFITRKLFIEDHTKG
ncbi:GtrA family protein [Diplocloster agilis]|uniref:GtrA family protein n=1 Tax=Diplocloster agilis TaxID=2850323 RepID=A0A949NHS1_9FIRM|nr:MULTISPECIES: GtrA family protein [Lachnospiraceae]MBU9736560.1 GtrA family protein [Diplocloster agilis]MCU6735164.1 GtrA family protein [Suonthocola fibrivorans]SCJ66128.1 GtrA-like protein [uncultured Clostridium sp.]